MENYIQTNLATKVHTPNQHAYRINESGIFTLILRQKYQPVMQITYQSHGSYGTWQPLKRIP